MRDDLVSLWDFRARYYPSAVQTTVEDLVGANPWRASAIDMVTHEFTSLPRVVDGFFKSSTSINVHNTIGSLVLRFRWNGEGWREGGVGAFMMRSGIRDNRLYMLFDDFSPRLSVSVGDTIVEVTEDSVAEQWVTCGINWGGGQAEGFVNGDVKASFSYLTQPPVGGVAAFLGAYSAGGTPFALPHFDYLWGAHFARKLTAAEHAELHTTGMDQVPPILLGEHLVQGNTLKSIGGPADSVHIVAIPGFRVFTKCRPEQDGSWQAFVPAGNYLVVYQAEGCAPITHGPYLIGEA